MERNVGTKEKGPKQDLTSAKNLTIKHPEGRQSPYYRFFVLLFRDTP